VAVRLVWQHWIIAPAIPRARWWSLCLNLSIGLPRHCCSVLVATEQPAFFADGFHCGRRYVARLNGIAFVALVLRHEKSENTAKLANLIFISPFLSLVFIVYFSVSEFAVY